MEKIGELAISQPEWFGWFAKCNFALLKKKGEIKMQRLIKLNNYKKSTPRKRGWVRSVLGKIDFINFTINEI